MAAHAADSEGLAMPDRQIRSPLLDLTDEEFMKAMFGKPEQPEVVMQARTPAIGELVEACAKGELNFDELCRRVAAMGYKTTSLFEMVRACEASMCDPRRGCWVP
jgi:hypothetical protein